MNLTITTFNLENLFTRYATIDDPGLHDNPRVVMTGVTSIDYQGNPLSAATTATQRKVAVGTVFVLANLDRPPHRSQRAGLPHWALALGGNAKTLLGPGMDDGGRGQPSSDHPAHPIPVEASALAPSP
jgi:hypothetical protein